MNTARIFSLLSVTLALSTLTFSPLVAAPAAPGGLTFGSVDLGKLVAGYTKGQTPDQQLQSITQQYETLIKTQANSPMLSKADQTTLGVLLLKSPRTSADDAQITALQTQSTSASQELTALQQKASPTPADKDRLTALTAQQQAGEQALEDAAADYKARLQSQQDTLSAAFSETLRTAIAAVARQKGLSVVFNSQVAVYSANDITPDVVKQLNK